MTQKGIDFLKEHNFISYGAAPVSLDEEKINHDHFVTHVRLAWQSSVKALEWIPERMLLNGHHDQIPDGEIVYLFKPREKKSRIGIEIELTLKSSSRYEKKFTDYEAGPYDWVFYFTDKDGIKDAILEISRGRTNIVYVCMIHDFLRHRMETRLVCHNDRFLIGERFL